MPVQTTSLFAYADIQKKIGPLQREIYHCIEKHPTGINNRAIAKETGVEINVVTPRVKELRELGLVEEAIKARDELTCKLTIFWKVKSQC